MSGGRKAYGGQENFEIRISEFGFSEEISENSQSEIRKPKFLKPGRVAEVRWNGTAFVQILLCLSPLSPSTTPVIFAESLCRF